MLHKTVNQQFYLGFKEYAILGQEFWVLGHPSLVEEVFVRRIDNYYKYSTNYKGLPKALLYVGDQSGYKHAKAALSPYFFWKNFSEQDALMISIVKNHITHDLQPRPGLISFSRHTKSSLPCRQSSLE